MKNHFNCQNLIVYLISSFILIEFLENLKFLKFIKIKYDKIIIS